MAFLNEKMFLEKDERKLDSTSQTLVLLRYTKAI